MKNDEILKILKLDRLELIEKGYRPEFYRTSFQGKELIILSAVVMRADSVFRKSYREIEFNNPASADKLFNMIKRFERNMPHRANEVKR